MALGGTGGLSPRRGPQEQKAADRSWQTGAGKAAAAAVDRRLLQARQPACKRMSTSSELGGCEPTAFQRLSRPADLHRALNKAHRPQTRAAAPCRLTQGLQTLGQPPGSAPRPPIHPLLAHSLCAANESGWPSPTSSAHLDFPAAGRWGPARLAAWLVLLHCFQKLLGVASCCWSAVGGVATGGLVAVVVLAGVRGRWVGGCPALTHSHAKSCELKRFWTRFFMPAGLL